MDHVVDYEGVVSYRFDVDDTGCRGQKASVASIEQRLATLEASLSKAAAPAV